MSVLLSDSKYEFLLSRLVTPKHNTSTIRFPSTTIPVRSSTASISHEIQFM
jgi:hypothetical protein